MQRRFTMDSLPHGNTLGRKRFAVLLISAYIEESVKNARGTAVSISIKQLKRWYSQKNYRGLSNRDKCAISTLLKRLHELGLVDKIAGKYVIKRGSKLWRVAEMEKTRYYMELILTEEGQPAETSKFTSTTDGEV